MVDGSMIHHVEVDGLRVAYRRAGQGPPLVLLHGILEDSRAWQRQITSLSDGFDVIAWDTPGCGASSDPPGGYSAADFADRLAGFIGALGLDRPNLLGLSWGGGLALELYRRHPGLPRQLILASSYAGWKGSLPPDEVEHRLAQVEREADLPPEDFVPGWIPGLLTESAASELRDEVIAIMSDFRPIGYRTMARAFADLDLRPILPTIAVPTLLLYGELDRRSPLSVARALHEAIPGSELVLIPGVGHLANVEAPDAFDAAVRAFLTARARRSGRAVLDSSSDPAGPR